MPVQTKPKLNMHHDGKKRLLLLALCILLVNLLYRPDNEAQGVIATNNIWHVVRGWGDWSGDVDQHYSASIGCNKYVSFNEVPACTTQLATKLQQILQLQRQARNRYNPLFQSCWMSTILVRSRGGNFQMMYLPFIEEREMVLSRFINHYELNSEIDKDREGFTQNMHRAMDDVSNRKILFVSLLVPGLLVSAVSLAMRQSPIQVLPVATLSAKLDRSKLGRLRLVLAYAVVLFHAMEMTGNDQWHKTLLSVDVGTFAASITHAITGLLSHDSLYRHGSDVFLYRRIVRLWPAFLFLAALNMCLLGPIVTGNPFFLVSRSGRRIFWWCVSGEFLFTFSDAIEVPMHFEVGEVLVTNFKTTVAVALWSMPQLALSWFVLALMHLSNAVHFYPLALITMSTLFAAGTGKDIYIAAFFFGATCGAAAAASKTPMKIETKQRSRGSMFVYFVVGVLSCSVLNVLSANVYSQLWKLLVAVACCCLCLWCWCGGTESKGSATTDAISGDLVLGTYVFGSGIQSVLATIVGKTVVVQDGIAATLFNVCLSLPLITLAAFALKKTVRTCTRYR